MILQYFSNQISSKRLLLTLIAFILILQQSSSQQVQTGTCHYYYNTENQYTCRLVNVNITNLITLEIVGDHLQNHTDSDVVLILAANSTIRHFNGEIMRKFENLKYLDMSRSGVRNFGKNAFENCQKLEEFRFVENDLFELPSKLLQNCENLKVFDVTFNKIMEISKDIFGETKNLEVFIVQINDLYTLHMDVLQNMRNLKIFDAKYNPLTYSRQKFRENNPNLEEFAISTEYSFTESEIIDFISGLTNLRKLHLAYTVNILNLTFMSQFEKLEELFMSPYLFSVFVLIKWQSLPTSLKKLEVYNIGEAIPEDAFQQLTNLTHLTFTGSGIFSLHSNTFKPLTKLESLTIRNTQIKNLDFQLFANQKNLHTLILDTNPIAELPNKIFTPLVNLGASDSDYGLIIIGSDIQKLDSSSFGVHPHLKRIDFKINKIDQIERGLFSHFPNLTYVNFDYNICVNKTFLNATNLDNHEDLEACYLNWENILNTTTESAGQNWRKFEIICLIFVGFLVSSLNY